MNYLLTLLFLTFTPPTLANDNVPPNLLEKKEQCIYKQWDQDKKFVYIRCCVVRFVPHPAAMCLTGAGTSSTSTSTKPAPVPAPKKPAQKCPEASTCA